MRALAFPLVIFAKPGLVLLHLGFEFAECFFAARSEMFAFGCGVERTGGEGQIERESVVIEAGLFCKNCVKLH